MARTRRTAPGVDQELAEQVQKELVIRASQLKAEGLGSRMLSAGGSDAPWSAASMYVGGVGYGSDNKGYFPQMPSINPYNANMNEFGAPGTAIFNGIITGEDYNPDFQWREGVRIYDMMRKNDYQVFSSLLMTDLPVRAGPRKIEPASDDPMHLDQASFIETALFHELDHTFDDTLRHAILSKAYGFMVMEKVFKTGKDGLTYWQKFAPRLPKTIWRWWIDENNELVGVQQWTFRDYTYKYLDIPAGKLLVFTHRQEGNNFEGTSVLRTAYKPWYYKDILLRIMGIGFEREHVGIPVFKLPPGYSAADLQRAQNIGKNMRSNEQAYITVPSTWIVEWLKGTAGRSSSHTPILDALALMDIAISRNVLTQQQNLGSTETGSYASAYIQNESLLMSLQGDAKQYAEVFNNRRTGAIPELVRYNSGETEAHPITGWVDPEIYPKLLINVSNFNIGDLLTAMGNASKYGLLTNTPDLEDFVRDSLGIPSAPQSVIEATKAGAQQLGMGVDPSTGKNLDPNAQESHDSDMTGQYAQANRDADSHDQQGEAHKQQMQKGKQDLERGIDAKRSKGKAGQDATITTHDIVPEQYRTQRYLSMRPVQRYLYAEMVHKAMRPYAVSKEFSDAILANRVPEDDPGFSRRVDVTKRRLKKEYRDLESTLVTGAPLKTDERHAGDDTKQLREAIERDHDLRRERDEQVDSRIVQLADSIREGFGRVAQAMERSETSKLAQPITVDARSTQHYAPQPVVLNPPPAPDVHVAPAQVDIHNEVNVPQQPAPIVNIAEGAIQSNPEINVDARTRVEPPQTTIEAGAFVANIDAPVHVKPHITLANPVQDVGDLEVKYDDKGRMIGVRRKRGA